MRGRRGILKTRGCRIRPLQRHLSVSVLTQLPVVILVFVIFECRLPQIKAPRTDKDGPAKGERDWVHENVVAPAVFTKAARHAARASNAILESGGG
jgi:hypothetical protein